MHLCYKSKHCLKIVLDIMQSHLTILAYFGRLTRLHLYYRSPSDNVPLAAIQGLSRLLTETEKLDKEFERELLSISQKIRPFMNTECAQLRENSIRLFGIIAGRVKSDGLMEQAVGSLPCFLLHLCDNNPAVVRVSVYDFFSILLR